MASPAMLTSTCSLRATMLTALPRLIRVGAASWPWRKTSPARRLRRLDRPTASGKAAMLSGSSVTSRRASVTSPACSGVFAVTGTLVTATCAVMAPRTSIS